MTRAAVLAVLVLCAMLVAFGTEKKPDKPVAAPVVGYWYFLDNRPMRF